MIPNRRLRHFGDAIRQTLGLGRNVLVMSAANALKGFGSGLWSGFLPKVLQTLGASGPVIGAVGTMNAGTSTVFSFLGGVISDRVGRGRALILSAVVSLAGYLVYLFSPSWWPFLPGSVLLSAGGFFAFMGSMALVGETVARDRRAVSMATLALLGLPFALLAPPIGGWILDRFGILPGFRASLVVTIVLTLAAILVQQRYYRLPAPSAAGTRLDLRSTWRGMRPELKRLLLANSLMSFGSGMSTLFVALYVMDVMGASVTYFGVLQSVVTAAGALASIPVGKLADRGGMGGRRRWVMLSFLAIALFPFLLVIAPSKGWLLPVFALRGIRDSFEIARKALIVDLADHGERGSVMGLYYLINGVVSFPSSFVAGFLWQWSAVAPFILGGAISAAGLLILLVTTPRRRVNGGEGHPAGAGT